MKLTEVTSNPAYEVNHTPAAGGAEPGTGTVDSSRSGTVGDAVQVGSSTGEVEALQKELERVKRSRGEYAAARVATELEKQSQQLQDDMQKKLEAARAEAAQAAQEAAEQAAQAAQEAAEETALLRAELALLKEKSE